MLWSALVQKHVSSENILTWFVIETIASSLLLFWFFLLFAHLKSTDFSMCWVWSIFMIFIFLAAYVLLPCWSSIQKQLSFLKLIYTIRTMFNSWSLKSSSEQIFCHDLSTFTRALSVATMKSESLSLNVRQLRILNSRLLLIKKENNVLVNNYASAQDNLKCLFNLPFCFKIFFNMKDWVEHSLIHFSNVESSDFNHCYFCDAWFSFFSEIFDWAKWMKHVNCHHRLNDKLAYAQLNFELYTYLWNNWLIINAEYWNLKKNNENQLQTTRTNSSQSEFLEESFKIYINTYLNSCLRHDCKWQDQEAFND